MIRLIVDARQANCCHQSPPRTRLGSVGALSEMDLSDEVQELYGGTGEVCEIEVRGSACDVDDCFYQFRVPEVASWFGVPRK
eukprot:8511960-Lingulodinium_polyedra.AAC.1